MNDSSSSGVVHTTAAAAEGVGASGSTAVGAASVGASSLGAAAAAAAAAGAGEGRAAAAAARHGHSGEGTGVDLGRRVPAFPDPKGKEVQLQRLSKLFFGGKAAPTNDGPDFSRRKVTPREQRHTELTDAAVKAAVNEVVQRLRDEIPLPTKDGRLKTPKAKKGGTLNSGGGGLPGAYITLEDSSVRARRCKGPGGWTAASKALARAHHLVTGTLVFLRPEVMLNYIDRLGLCACVCGR